MKFVFFGYDFMLATVRRLLKDGHELSGVFTFECDNVFNFNQEIIALAESTEIPLTLSRPEPNHIEAFISHGAECFLSAGYPFKIPPIDKNKAYGINVHPSLLPKGRGIMPTPYIIMHEPEAGGISVHKLAPQFDAGDILYQEPLDISEQETVESYSEQIADKAPEIISKVMADLPRYWSNATLQDEGKASHFPPPDDEMRTIDWNSSVEDIDRLGRAFGHFGSLARFDDHLWGIYDFEVWKESHHHPPGTVIERTDENILITASDGFANLKRFQKIT